MNMMALQEECQKTGVNPKKATLSYLKSASKKRVILDFLVKGIAYIV